jgi:predicted N-formylglutamate amidohydrolase
VPDTYWPYFRERQDVLASHRGYDAGALDMGAMLATSIRGKFFAAKVTRLLVDLNRSEHHPRLHDPAIHALPATDRAEIKRQYYTPYRQQVESYIADRISRGSVVIHISSHSFTPVLEGVQRSADVGLLYDPRRPGEQAFALRWQSILIDQGPFLRVRRNYPYRGTSDGFTTYLRKRFDAHHYVGLELEINQRWPLGVAKDWESLQHIVAESFRQVLNTQAVAGVSTRT